MNSHQSFLYQQVNDNRFESAKITGINRWIWFTVGIWTFAIMSSFFWNDYQIEVLVMDKARSELRANFFIIKNIIIADNEENTGTIKSEIFQKSKIFFSKFSRRGEA